MESRGLGHTGVRGVSRLQRSQAAPAHLDTPVVYPGGLALDAAGVAAAGAALHLHAGRPYQEVGRGGVDLAPRYLVDHRPRLAHRRDGLLCRHRRVTAPGEHPCGSGTLGPLLPVPTGHW